MNDIQRSQAPPGAMVMVDVNNIDEGNFVRDANALIGRAIQSLAEYERDPSNGKGSVQVTLQIFVEPLKGAEHLRVVRTRMHSKVPQRQRVSDAKLVGDKLLCQPIGTNEDVDQQTFFDGRGNIIGADGHPKFIDQNTGEVRDSIKMPRAAQG